MNIRKGLFDLRHPAFDGSLYADRYFGRDGIDHIRLSCYSSHETIRLSESLGHHIPLDGEGTPSVPPHFPIRPDY
jgi:hypothetical protein